MLRADTRDGIGGGRLMRHLITMYEAPLGKKQFSNSALRTSCPRVVESRSRSAAQYAYRAEHAPMRSFTDLRVKQTCTQCR